jgi:DNA repair exonuclease SbcCD ATPase subunit
MTFDLERARGLRDFLQDDCAEVGDVWGEMIAEIERLRAETEEAQESLTAAYLLGSHKKAQEMAARIKELEADLEQAEICIQARLDVIDQQAARIKSLKKEIRRLKHESKVEQEFTNSYIKRLHDAEARIKELGSSLDEAEALTKKNAELMNGYLRRIAELEDALVEGLTNFLHYRASCYDPARRCPYAKECDDCSTWDACGHVEKFRSEARRRLQAEGKIGSSDHSSDVTKKVWQITEERKAAIWHAVAVLKENDPDDEHLWDEEIAVLRAMLTEAE